MAILRNLKICLAALPLVMGTVAQAADMVVVEASGVSLAPGQVVDGDKEIELPAGAKITLIGQDGTPIQLAGPYSGAPGAGSSAGGKNDVVGALAQLLGGGNDGQTRIGATRSVTNTTFALPNPGSVPVGRSGDYCVIVGGPTSLWRVDASEGIVVSMTASDGSWEGKVPWPAGQSHIPLPPNFPQTQAQAFKLVVGTQSSDIVLHRMPNGLNKPGLQAAWMVGAGCDLQAKALLASLQ
ncbi:MAG: hypothetical protein ABJ215_05070 [Alphaproteobacteria bacterium]